MPYHWVRIASSDPGERKTQVEEALKAVDKATLVGDEIYFDHYGQAYALIKWPDGRDDAELEKLLGDQNGGIRGTSWKGLVDGGEKKDKKPPQSRKRPLGS